VIGPIRRLAFAVGVVALIAIAGPAKAGHYPRTSQGSANDGHYASTSQASANAGYDVSTSQGSAKARHDPGTSQGSAKARHDPGTSQGPANDGHYASTSQASAKAGYYASTLQGLAKAGHDPGTSQGPAEAGYDSWSVGETLPAQPEPPSAPRGSAPLTLLQINDVYSTVPVDGLGGLARVATLKQQLIAARRTPFLVIAGDFLSPSVASSVFKGEQMIAALNATGLDLATLGNHEFDFGDDVLIERMREAKWQWIIANVIDTNTGLPIGGAAPYIIKTFGALKVGFIGLGLTTNEINRNKLTHTQLIDPLEAAGRYLPQMKRDGATVIVAVTHLAFATDRALVEKFPEIDVVIGGHEHFPITAIENRTLISKAGSDARWVARIDVNRRPEGTIERFFDLVPMTSAIPDNAATAAVIAAYETRLGAELDIPIGTARVPLVADDLHLRASETNLGDFIADAMRADAETDIALMNSGSIRGNRVYPAGPVTRRTLIAMHPFGNIICKLAVSGRVVLEMLNNGVAKLPAAAGQFPQVSGIRMTVDLSKPEGDRVRDVTINGQPLDRNRSYTLAVPDFLLSGGDAYTMFAGQRVLVDHESGNPLLAAIVKAVSAQKEIAPQTDGRITIVR
jgi:5'-nucleotidase